MVKLKSIKSFPGASTSSTTPIASVASLGTAVVPVVLTSAEYLLDSVPLVLEVLEAYGWFMI
jgi:hypothetical protein